MGYKPIELRVLWYLKSAGGSITNDKGSIPARMAEDIRVSVSNVRTTLGYLEKQSLVIRTYRHALPENAQFGDARGNILLKVELVDPNMPLPPCPPPIPLVAVLERENEELYERTAVEPDLESALVAVLARNDELQAQVTKLQDVVVALTEQLEKIQKTASKRPVPEHLTAKVRDALTDEQWSSLTHTGRQ